MTHRKPVENAFQDINCRRAEWFDRYSGRLHHRGNHRLDATLEREDIGRR